MPDPNDNDLWIQGNFEATVIAFKDDTLITVEDAECDAWDVEANRVEI